MCKKKMVNDNGLGDKVSDLEKGYSAPKGVVGKEIIPLVSQVGMMFGKATGTGLITSLVPKKIVKGAGIDVNPLSMMLAPMTFGVSLLPGVSQVLGKVFGVFSGMFSKATHFGDCMKFETDNNYVMYSLGGSIIVHAIKPPDPVNVEQSFPEISQEYYKAHLKKASEIQEVLWSSQHPFRTSPYAQKLPMPYKLFASLHSLQ